MRKQAAKAFLAALLAPFLSACGTQDTGPVAQAPRAPRAHLVQVAEAGMETLRRSSVHTGTLRARRSQRVFSREEGRITYLPFYEGDAVRAGEILMRLDDALLKAELEKSEATRRQAGVDLKRLERLIRQKLVAEDELARARTALEVAQAEEKVLRTRLGYTIESAPFDALVSARLAEPGDVVTRHTHVLSVTDPASLVTEIDVSELILPEVRVGDPVQVRIDALGTTDYPGKVLRIHPELDTRSRHGRIEVGLTPVPEGAIAGQFCRVTLEGRKRARLVIPFPALRRDREGQFVYRLEAGDTVSRVAVRGGERLRKRMEIIEGLEPGDRVVTRGFLGLRDGLEVKVVDGHRDE